MSFFLSLPQDVVYEHLLPCLALKDYLTLDTALSNERERQQFHKLLESYRCALSTGKLQTAVQLTGIGLTALTLYFTGNAPYDPIRWIGDEIAWCNLFNKTPKLQNLVSYRQNHVGILWFAENFKELRDVTLSIPQSYTDGEIVRAFCHNCPHILHWRMHCRVVDAALSDIAEAYPNLQTLELWCDTIDVTVITTHCHNLTTLILHSGATNATITPIGENCKNLRHLVISGEGITAVALKPIWVANPHLTQLHLFGCSLIRDDIVFLSMHCSNLEKFAFLYCGDFSDADRTELAGLFPRLHSRTIPY